MLPVDSVSTAKLYQPFVKFDGLLQRLASQLYIKTGAIGFETAVLHMIYAVFTRSIQLKVTRRCFDL